MNLNFFAIIPARGGSKGIPRKNIKILSGKPLIEWTIEASKKSKYINKVLVSTEDDEIANVSTKCGAEIIKRPDELAKDESPTIDAIFNALESLRIERSNTNVVVLLQPTSPLRNEDDIDKSIELFMSNDCESVISVCEVEHPPYWCFNIQDGVLKSLYGDEYFKKRRQDLPKAYIPNGAIYIANSITLYKYKSFYSQKILPYIMPREKSIDIDTDVDFTLAELIMNSLISEDKKIRK